MQRERDASAHSDDSSFEPPDGGIRAYLVTLASFLTNGLIFGVINSYSVMYTDVEAEFKLAGDENAASSAALVGSLAISATFLLSPLSDVMTALLGLRQTAIMGGTIATTGLLLSSFFTNNFVALCFFYGAMYGLGASLAYTPSLAILGHYFKKYLGVINGIATVGSSIFTIIMPPIMEAVLKNYGLPWLFRFLSLVTVGMAVCGFIFKPTMKIDENKSYRNRKDLLSYIRSLINCEVWQSKRYRLWALTMPIALFGYFVPYVHIKKFIKYNFVGVNQLLPLQCIAIASAVGRLIFGFIADKPGVDTILMQQICFYVIGSLTMLLPVIKWYGMVIVVALIMGFFDGGFIALIGPIAFDVCGSAHAGDGIAYVLGLAAVPLSVGPPVAGFLYDHYKSYTVPFILSGLSPIIGSTLMFVIRIFGNEQND